MSSMSQQTWLPSGSLRTSEPVARLSWIVLLILAFFLLLWEQSGNASVLRTASHQITKPSIQLTSRMLSAQKNTGKWWQFTQQGTAHIAQLENEVRSLQIDRAKLDQLEEENAVLRNELNFSVSTDEQVTEWYGTDQQWFINLGCQNGIVPGALVTADGVFVGVVETAYPTYSEVRTWDDPSWRLSAKIGTESAYGVFSFGRSIPEVEEVPIIYKGLVGASVRTAGQADVPANYLLGTVQEVIEEPGFGTVRMVVSPAVNLREVVFVRVEKEDRNTCGE